jgi:hypothetical protein
LDAVSGTVLFYFCQSGVRINLLDFWRSKVYQGVPPREWNFGCELMALVQRHTRWCVFDKKLMALLNYERRRFELLQ